MLTIRVRQGADAQLLSAGRSPGTLRNCEAAKGSGVNFPLSTYSASRKKNVSEENKNIFGHACELRASQLAQLRQQPLALLPESVRGGSPKLVDTLGMASFELALHKQIQLLPVEFALFYTPAEKMPEQSFALQRIFDSDARQQFLLTGGSSIPSPFAVRPGKHLTLHGARNGERKMRPSHLEIAGVQMVQKHAQRLLRDVFQQERRLMFHHLANRPMQGRKKNQYQKRFDELPVDGAQGEKLSQQGIGVRVPV